MNEINETLKIWAILIVWLTFAKISIFNYFKFKQKRICRKYNIWYF